jgi:hypothetical protein
MRSIRECNGRTIVQSGDAGRQWRNSEAEDGNPVSPGPGPLPPASPRLGPASPTSAQPSSTRASPHRARDTTADGAVRRSGETRWRGGVGGLRRRCWGRVRRAVAIGPFQTPNHQLGPRGPEGPHQPEKVAIHAVCRCEHLRACSTNLKANPMMASACSPIHLVTKFTLLNTSKP